MTTDEREALGRLAALATPGPWTARWGDVSGPEPEYATVVGLEESSHGYLVSQELVLKPADAAFIAAARDAIPSLLRDLRAAEARATKAERERDEQIRRFTDLDERASARLRQEWERAEEAQGRAAAAEAERTRLSRLVFAYGKEADEATGHVAALLRHMPEDNASFGAGSLAETERCERACAVRRAKAFLAATQEPRHEP